MWCWLLSVFYNYRIFAGKEYLWCCRIISLISSTMLRRKLEMIYSPRYLRTCFHQCHSSKRARITLEEYRSCYYWRFCIVSRCDSYLKWPHKKGNLCNCLCNCICCSATLETSRIRFSWTHFMKINMKSRCKSDSILTYIRLRGALCDVIYTYMICSGTFPFHIWAVALKL